MGRKKEGERECGRWWWVSPVCMETRHCRGRKKGRREGRRERGWETRRWAVVPVAWAGGCGERGGERACETARMSGDEVCR